MFVQKVRRIIEDFKNDLSSNGAYTDVRTMLRLFMGDPTNPTTQLRRFLEIKTIEERIALAVGGTSYTLTKNLPAGAIVIGASINLDTAVTLATAVKIGIGFVTSGHLSDFLLSGTGMTKNEKYQQWLGLLAAGTALFPDYVPAGTAITSMARTAGVVTVTKSSHGLAVGQQVQIAASAAASTSFNGRFTITAVTTNTFTYTQAGTAESATTAGFYRASLPILLSAVDTNGALAGTFNAASQYVRAQIVYAQMADVPDA